METFRCFIAVDITDEAKKILSEAQKYLQAGKARVKWVEEVNFHLTLKFLGEVSQTRLSEVQSSLRIIAGRHRISEFSVGGAGAFPNIRNPKIIWAGLKDSQDALSALHRDVDQEMSKLGFAREQKKFSPHLTLGRIKESGPAPRLAELLMNVAIQECVVPLREFRLMRSKLTPQGPEYSSISSFGLQEHF